MRIRTRTHIGILLLRSLVGVLIAASPSAAQDQDPFEITTVARENLGPRVNSMSIEILPIVSADGRTLYFDRKYDSANVGGEDDEDDIYYSTLRDDGTWSDAVNIGPSLNSPGSDVLFWVAPDGGTALIHSGKILKKKVVVKKTVKGKTRDVEETVETKAGLAIVTRTNGVWSEPVPIRIQGVDNIGDGYYAFISPDRRRLLISYAADSTNRDNLDIFVCNALSTDLVDWGAPVSLGLTINTPKFEGAPFVAADGRTLYFASDGHSGLGGSDIFVTRRIGESWFSWTDPVNLGPTVNTPLFEASFSFAASGDYIYMSGSGFHQDEVSYGRSDLFRLKLPEEARPAPAALISGSLVGKSGGVEGLIRVERKTDGVEIFSTTSDARGEFTLILPLNAEYRIIGWANGYEERQVDLQVREQIQSGLTIRLSASGEAPIEGNLLGRRPVIYFTSGSDMMSGKAISLLKQYLPSMRRGSDITVVGHADAIGEEENNQDLSVRRATRVSEWLVKQGVERSRIATIGRGESEPAASNDTVAGRASNRRVEILGAAQ